MKLLSAERLKEVTRILAMACDEQSEFELGSRLRAACRDANAHIDALTVERDEAIAKKDELHLRLEQIDSREYQGVEDAIAKARREALEEAAKAIERHVSFYHGSTPTRLVESAGPDGHARLYAKFVRDMADREGTVKKETP